MQNYYRIATENSLRRFFMLHSRVCLRKRPSKSTVISIAANLRESDSIESSADARYRLKLGIKARNKASKMPKEFLAVC